MNNIISKIRKEKHLTQEEVYKNLCSRRHYSRIENNKSEPSVYLLFHFAKILNVNMEDLLIEEEE